MSNGTAFGRLLGCVGGRSLFWNGASPRYRADDFDGWPLSVADLHASYEWAETDFRVSRDYGSSRLTKDICDRLKAQSFAAEAGPFAIDTRATTNGWIGGTIANAVSGLLRSGFLGRADRSLCLSARSFAKRILLVRSTGRAAGVAAIDRVTGEEYEIYARAVVLAAGALESARLALASSIRDDSGLVGRFVTEHLFFRAYYVIPPTIYDQAKPEAAIVFVPSTKQQRYQLEIHLPGNTLFHQKADSKWAPAETPEYAAMARSFGAIISRKENCIAVTSADAPGGYTVHFSYAPEDDALRDEMRAAMERVRAALEATPQEPELLPPGASYHEAGGLVMGTDRRTSVTDPFGRFHMVQNVVAADAATWPRIGAANPHLTIAALSRRQATQLAKDVMA
jgi:choline dehydrogenase-like flavoprotein